MFNHTASREARLSAGKNQTDAASAARVSVSTLARWERGDGEPSFTQGLALAKFYGVKPEHLLHEEAP